MLRRNRSDVDVGTSRQSEPVIGQGNASNSASLPREINLDELPYDPVDRKRI